jgi:hypothetical protein
MNKFSVLINFSFQKNITLKDKRSYICTTHICTTHNLMYSNRVSNRVSIVVLAVGLTLIDMISCLQYTWEISSRVALKIIPVGIRLPPF